jgi:hypothetical protein
MGTRGKLDPERNPQGYKKGWVIHGISRAEEKERSDLKWK